ncbi:hypothetical protein DPV78_010215 [Talaromyces pinophilus]|nr:hypothetical protein DPV78_010215 [Talaromyces pinophilus]
MTTTTTIFNKLLRKALKASSMLLSKLFFLVILEADLLLFLKIPCYKIERIIYSIPSDKAPGLDIIPNSF